MNLVSERSRLGRSTSLIGLCCSMQPADIWREKAALDPEGLRPYLWCHDPVVHLIFDKSHASELGESVAGW